MTLPVTLSLPDDPGPERYADAIDIAWGELQFHTEICEEPEHAADCSVALDLLDTLRSALLDARSPHASGE